MNPGHALQKAIGYLHNHQYPNGEFCAYMSGDDAMQTWVQPMGMIFPTAIICHSLLFAKDDPKIEEMLAKSATFLRYQIGRGATWNHFTNDHPLRHICPQDVDDTACVSSFLLTRYDDFKKLANSKLICDNRNKDGLLYTWFTFRLQPNGNRSYWRLAAAELKHPVKSFFFWREGEAGRYNIDAVVNANALYYLGDIPEMQPVINHLIKIIADNKEADCDTWYRNPFTVYYFFSRCYYSGINKLEPVRQPVIDRILSQANAEGRIGVSVLDTALAACALLNLHYNGPALANAINYLVNTQRETGEWARRLLYYGGPKKLSGYGSEEIVTAICLEAIARFLSFPPNDQ
ncbi:MAG: hypothetical protein WCF67_09480 [Chitinophagaceae bacterium]